MSSCLLRGAGTRLTAPMRVFTAGNTGLRVNWAGRAYSGRAYEPGEIPSKGAVVMELITTQNNLIKEHNSKYCDLASRVQTLEARSVSGDVPVEKVARLGSQVEPIIAKRIRIRGTSFTVNKMVAVCHRPSTFWRKYPFVVKLTYRKRTTDLLVGDPVKRPDTLELEEHTFKCKDQASAITLVREIIAQCPHLRNK
jgi:hypothetical protein